MIGVHMSLEGSRDRILVLIHEGQEGVGSVGSKLLQAASKSKTESIATASRVCGSATIYCHVLVFGSKHG